ncbi:MAG: hypothetical protein JSW71_01465 [Gemmatimonadota bacterium]|nr:MAG: hypothetical protein JSW71_01465 [Gemmatimonadota bacterium]
MANSLDDGARQAVVDMCRQHMAADVRDLIASVKLLEARRDEGELPDDLSRKRFRDARQHLFEAARLAMANGLSRLEVHTTITAAARREAMTEAVRLALYEVIEEIGLD